MAHKGVIRVGLEGGSGELKGGLQHSGRQLLVPREEFKKTFQIESEFMARISHESRTLLNIVIGFTELMLDEVMGKINEEQRRSLTEILNSGKRLLNLINNSAEQSTRESVKKP